MAPWHHHYLPSRMQTPRFAEWPGLNLGEMCCLIIKREGLFKLSKKKAGGLGARGVQLSASGSRYVESCTCKIAIRVAARVSRVFWGAHEMQSAIRSTAI